MSRQPIAEVIIGNVGTVHWGTDIAKARTVFAQCVEWSRAPHGRAAGEDVTLLVGDDIEAEHTGWLHDGEEDS